MAGGVWFVLSAPFLVLVFILTATPLFSKKLRNTPHGSMGWPFLGETLSFLRPHNSITIGSFLEDHCSRYGKIFKSHLFGCPTIVSCDQELNSFILQNEERLFQCSYPKPIHGVLGRLSMLVVVGDTHKRLRSLALNLVHTWKSKSDYLQDIEEHAISLMETWRGRDEIVFSHEARKFTFNVIVKQILSLKPDEPQTAMILEDFLTFMRGLVSFPLYIPGTPYAKAVKARSRISCNVKQIVEGRREVSKDNSTGDFLDILISNSSLCDEERVSLVLDLLLGGYETTSMLMAMAAYFLGHSPSALEQLKAEHLAIRSKKHEGENLNWEDYKQMEFTQNSI
ncbi:Cytochrome P450 724B1 [Nymphaea thermarum]|nr:Cytochrome P450 724B1 [Nymphaea thermarum]